MPKNNLWKIGVATAAAAVGAILAFTSVFAHTTPTTTGRSVVGTIVNAATGATLVSFNDTAPQTVTDEQDQDAVEAADLAAEIAAEQAAKLAAEQAEEAAEAAAATCIAGDKTEDTTEKAADQSEDTSETSATESATEDSAEMASRQATDQPEDKTETPCAGAEGEHHDGDSHESSTQTFSSEGDH